jgi:hypothetical protein
MFHAPKIPKTQKPDKTPFTLHNPHTLDLRCRAWPKVIRFLSIDPGTDNYAIRVEERCIDKDTFTNTSVKTLLSTNNHLKRKYQSPYEDDQNYLPLYRILTDILDENLELFLTCHIVVVERQMPFNYKASRVMQHTLTYFFVKMKDNYNLPLILEVDPKLKGKELMAPKTLNSRGLKEWAIEKARHLFMLRGDKLGLELLETEKKQDDVADTACQIEALCSYLGYPLTSETGTQTADSSEPSNSSNSSNSFEPSTSDHSTIMCKKYEPLPFTMKELDSASNPKGLVVTQLNIVSINGNVVGDNKGKGKGEEGEGAEGCEEEDKIITLNIIQ